MNKTYTYINIAIAWQLHIYSYIALVYCYNGYTSSYYNICHRNIGGEHNRNVKITSLSSHDHNQHLLLYMLAEQLSTGLGRFLGCQKCNILVIIQSRVLYLIYIHSPLDTVHVPLGVMCIYQAKHSCLCYNLQLVASSMYI